MKNILIVNTQEFNPRIGGVEKVTDVLVPEFLKNGYNITLLACIKSKYSKKYKPAAVQYFLPVSDSYLNKENIEYFEEVVIENKIDIIMNQAGNILEFSQLCINVSKIMRTKLISIVHIDPLYQLNDLKFSRKSILNIESKFKIAVKQLAYPYLYNRTYRETQKLYKYVYSGSDMVVLLSNHFIKPFLKLLELQTSNKLFAISNPQPEISDKEIVLINKKQIIYVGRVAFGHKRTDVLLKIWESIFKDYPDWQLTIVGDGPLLNRLKEYTHTKKIERISFTGFDNPINYYKESEILCMTSSYEGLAMVLIEGMSYGCIPVAFDSFASIHDIIENNKNGKLIKINMIDGYEKELRDLLDNEIKRKEMRKEVINGNSKFSKDKIVQDWIRLFNTL